jgi:hypothetical protein
MAGSSSRQALPNYPSSARAFYPKTVTLIRPLISLVLQGRSGFPRMDRDGMPRSVYNCVTYRPDNDLKTI